jgi:heme exporter protein A
MLEAFDLECVRGSRTLFSGVGFSLREGELLRVTGPNGAGKTSLLRIVCGLLPAERGEVAWRGRNIRRLREDYWKELAYIGHANAVKDDLTAAENVTIACTISGVAADRAAVHEALERLGLGGCASLPARVLSQGQRRRLALARLPLSGGLPLWILDEPFTALDADATARVQALVAEHAERGGAVIYTTHLDLRIEAAAAFTIELGASAAARANEGEAPRPTAEAARHG